jgi:F5/8 type C domain
MFNCITEGSINIALGKATAQSSVYNSNGFQQPSNFAVDGNTDPHFENNPSSCSCTSNTDLDPWWYVDLGAAYNVQGVLVTNRDTAGEYS